MIKFELDELYQDSVFPLSTARHVYLETKVFNGTYGRALCGLEPKTKDWALYGPCVLLLIFWAVDLASSDVVPC